MTDLLLRKKFLASESFTTFAQRGTAVPFTARPLSNARVRRGIRGIEIIMPNFSTARGVYIVACDSLPQVVQLSAHDRMLHEMLLERQAVLPHEIEKITQVLGESGLAGGEAQIAALRAKTENAQDFAMTHFQLLRAVTQRLVTDGRYPPIELMMLTTPDGRRQIREMLGHAAAAVGLTAQEMYDKIEKWSEMASAAGSPGETQVGRLRRCVGDMKWMSTALDQWAKTEGVENQEIGGLAACCAASANETAACAQAQQVKLDDFTHNVANAVKQWESTQPDIDTAIRQMTSILDGWRPIIDSWKGASKAGRVEQRETLDRIGCQLPILPDEAFAAATLDWSRQAREHKRRWLGAYECWLSGRIDSEVVERVGKGGENVAVA